MQRSVRMIEAAVASEGGRKWPQEEKEPVRESQPVREIQPVRESQPARGSSVVVSKRGVTG